MVQTYQGYFLEDGRFISDTSTIRIPARRRAIVNVLVDETVDNTRQQKTDTLDKIMEKALKAESTGILTNADWDEFENIRSQTVLERRVNV
jgi:hypothetical protein